MEHTFYFSQMLSYYLVFQLNGHKCNEYLIFYFWNYCNWTKCIWRTKF